MTASLSAAAASRAATARSGAGASASAGSASDAFAALLDGARSTTTDAGASRSTPPLRPTDRPVRSRPTPQEHAADRARDRVAGDRTVARHTVRTDRTTNHASTDRVATHDDRADDTSADQRPDELTGRVGDEALRRASRIGASQERHERTGAARPRVADADADAARAVSTDPVVPVDDDQGTELPGAAAAPATPAWMPVLVLLAAPGPVPLPAGGTSRTGADPSAVTAPGTQLGDPAALPMAAPEPALAGAAAMEPTALLLQAAGARLQVTAGTLAAARRVGTAAPVDPSPLSAASGPPDPASPTAAPSGPGAPVSSSPVPAAALSGLPMSGPSGTDRPVSGPPGSGPSGSGLSGSGPSGPGLSVSGVSVSGAPVSGLPLSALTAAGSFLAESRSARADARADAAGPGPAAPTAGGAGTNAPAPSQAAVPAAALSALTVLTGAPSAPAARPGTVGETPAGTSEPGTPVVAGNVGTTTGTPVTAAAATAAAPRDPELAQQLTRQMVLLRGATNGASEMTVQVTPDSLGPVTVHALVTDGRLELTMRGAHDQARLALLDAVPDLRQDLTAAGLVVTRVDVDSSTDTSTWSGPRQDTGQQQSGSAAGFGTGTGAGQQSADSRPRPWRPAADTGATLPARTPDPSASVAAATGLDVRA